MSDLWRGSMATRARIISGLILLTYALTHFINIGLGLFSPVWLDAVQDARQLVTRHIVGEVLLYGALLTHVVLALSRLIQRRSLRMPASEAMQYILGFAIPLLLITHITYTRGAHEIHAVNDQMGFLMYLIWNSSSSVTQTILLIMVWVHGCIGLHFWLRGRRWWQRAKGVLIGLATLIPGFALAGFVTEARRLHASAAAYPDRHQTLLEDWNFPTPEAFANLARIDAAGYRAFLALLVAALALQIVRRLLARRTSVTLRYANGPTITAPKGMTLLEMSRTAGVPHTSLCGGKGRCTTCRVTIDAGADTLAPPSETEARSLAAVSAAPGTRLACQIRPTQTLSVTRIFDAGGKRARAPAASGQERQLAILFLDMRGFTARTDGQLPYDVVFLLNRFFNAVVPAVTTAGGTIDKYMGDGFLALFETADTETSARAALAAVEGVGTALATFNETLRSEGSPPVAIGMGVHLGNVVLGEIGAAGQAPRTLIGDAVNTASRLEGQTKAFAVEALISEDILIAAGLRIASTDLTALSLRGRTSPLPTLPVKEASQLRNVLSTLKQEVSA